MGPACAPTQPGLVCQPSIPKFPMPALYGAGYWRRFMRSQRNDEQSIVVSSRFKRNFFVPITAFSQQSLYLSRFLITRQFVLDFIVPSNIDDGSV
jgi:hypothetical protein